MDKGRPPKKRPLARLFSRFGGLVVVPPKNPDGSRKERRKKTYGGGGFHIGSKSRHRTSTGRSRKRRLTDMTGGAFGGRTWRQRREKVDVVGDCVTRRAEEHRGLITVTRTRRRR